MVDRSQQVVQLVDIVAASVTPAFKAAVRRGADRRGTTLADYIRGALSERLEADGVRHQRAGRNNSRGATA